MSVPCRPAASHSLHGRIVEGRGRGIDGGERALLGLLPDHNLVIERARSEERAELGMGPSAHPNGTIVAGQVREQSLRLAGDIEHLDRAVGRASRDSLRGSRRGSWRASDLTPFAWGLISEQKMMGPGSNGDSPCRSSRTDSRGSGRYDQIRTPPGSPPIPGGFGRKPD